VTLTRIARSLNVSVTTVSRALGGYDDVAPGTRERVAAEAARIGYRPNQIARRLRSGRSGAIAIVLPAAPGHFDDPFFMRMLAGVGPHLAAAGLDLLVSTASPGADELATYRHLVEGKRVDGLIVCRTRRHDARIAYLLDSGIPFVVHGRTETRRPYAYVDIDGEAAGYVSTKRLVDLGHRRIGLINAARTYMISHFRELGWRRALDEAALPAGPLAHVEPTEENGFRAAGDFLRAEGAPTALFCATDRIAVGALHAVAGLGLRAGRDVSVIGYDNLPLATYTDPPLTTMEQTIERAAKRLVEILLALFAGADPANFHELWEAELIVRSSDGPAPGDGLAAPLTAGTRGDRDTHHGRNE
jgi:LacI family transcriptional regulator